MQVTLKKPHTHAGEQKQPGDLIEVDAGTAQWLADLGVIERPAPLPEKAGTKTPAQKG